MPLQCAMLAERHFRLILQPWSFLSYFFSFLVRYEPNAERFNQVNYHRTLIVPMEANQNKSERPSLYTSPMRGEALCRPLDF
eukprot:1953346-Amphidinium_carterae.1